MTLSPERRGRDAKSLERPVDVHGVDVGHRFAGKSIKERLLLETGAAAVFAANVASVLGKKHPDVHLVGARLEPLEKSFDAVENAVSLDHQTFVSFGKLFPGSVGGDAVVSGRRSSGRFGLPDTKMWSRV